VRQVDRQAVHRVSCIGGVQGARGETPGGLEEGAVRAAEAFRAA